MPRPPRNSTSHRGLARAALWLLLGAIIAAWVVHAPPNARAQTRQIAIFQDDTRLLASPGATLQQLRELGVQMVRVTVHWNTIAPARRPVNPTNPASYPAINWSVYDQIVADAHKDGIAVDFSLSGGAPGWATGPGQPRPPVAEWKPSASAFGAFVQAVGTRYSGSYDPAIGGPAPGNPSDLPRVSFWEVWNEPNFGQALAPQAIKGSTVLVSPASYRSLLDAAWSALHKTGHGRDKIVVGALDARGQTARPRRGAPDGLPGTFGSMKPMVFVRALYCVNASYHQLRGKAAAVLHCPTKAAGSRRFRSQHPALFAASGWSAHPYPVNQPPTKSSNHDPNFIEFSQMSQFGHALDRLTRTYGSHKRFPVYNTEYGYITNPPNHSPVLPSGHFVAPATAALDMNWAEYLSYRNPRIASWMQFLLSDPNPHSAANFGGFASGLISFNGSHKPGYNAYRLPLFLPHATARRGHRLLVWGAARPAPIARADTGGTPQRVQIQFQRGSRGAFKTLRTVTIKNPRGYFTARVKFPAGGSVRLAWAYPTGDPLLSGGTVFSRTVRVRVG